MLSREDWGSCKSPASYRASINIVPREAAVTRNRAQTWVPRSFLRQNQES
jgi:hypothetical protein